MSNQIQSRVKELKQQIQQETEKYTIAIREGNFTRAKAIKQRINDLQAGMDRLMPYRR